MFKQLVGYQDEVLGLLAQAEAALLSDDEKRVATLGRTRWELARVLSAYQAAKHVRLFDPLIDGRGPRAGTAIRMKSDCIRMGDSFRAFILRWSVMAILDEWEDYKAAALSESARLRAHLCKERVGLASLLAPEPDGAISRNAA